jgi:hypothetical protein
MRKCFGKIAIALVSLLILFGCADESPKIDYYDIDAEIVLNTDITLNHLLKALEIKFKTATYEENHLITAGPLKMTLEKDGNRLTILETAGGVGFMSLLAFGYQIEEESPTGVTLLKYLEDDEGAKILNTGRVLRVLLELE